MEKSTSLHTSQANMLKGPSIPLSRKQVQHHTAYNACNENMPVLCK